MHHNIIFVWSFLFSNGWIVDVVVMMMMMKTVVSPVVARVDELSAGTHTPPTLHCIPTVGGAPAVHRRQRKLIAPLSNRDRVVYCACLLHCICVLLPPRRYQL